MREDPIGDEVVSAFHSGVVDGLRTERLDAHNPIPEDVRRSRRFKYRGPENLGAPGQLFSRWATLVERRTAVLGANRRLELALGHSGAPTFRLDQVPNFDRQGVHIGIGGAAF